MTTLNWRLILALSLFGLGMAFATVWVIPSKIEPLFWLLIFAACAFLIARLAPRRHFLHGFLVSLVNSVWITSAHALFASAYLANHAQEAEMLKTMPMPDSPRLMMMMTGPVVGVASGLVLGGLAWLASRLVKPASAGAAT
jgi:hypothetical protein